MNLAEAARSGWRDVWANKVRSALSFSAISVGVASLLYTMAQTRGMQVELQRNLELMGPGRLTVQKNREHVSRGLSPGLTFADAQAIRAEVPGLYMVDAYAADWGDRMVVAGQALPSVHVDAVTEEWRKRDWVYQLRGRFLNSRDVQDASRVCVLLRPGGWVHKPFWAKYWDEEDPLGQLIDHHDLLGRGVLIQDRLFRVVGILDLPPRDKDPRWESWNNPNALVPITSFQRFLRRDDSPLAAVDEIRVDTGDEKTLPQARRRIESLLRERHRGEDDFEIHDLREQIEGQLANMRKYVRAGLALGIVALLAGGIGIMNVTLATIFSRVKEIGIRRAVGAGKLDIMAQFLLEAAWLGLAGGAAGLGLGLAGLKALERWGEENAASVTWYHCAALILLGALVSAGFAFFPAYQAAGLDPVEALRSE